VAEKKVASGVLALSSAAVMTIYGAGYARTQQAADRFAQQASERHPRSPRPPDPSVATPPAAAAAEAPSRTSPPVPAPSAPAPEDAALPAAPIANSRKAAPAPVPPAATTAEPDQGAAVTPSKASPILEEDGPSAAAAAPVPSAPVAPPVPPAPAPAEPTKAAYKDGTYYGWGTSRHGDIQAAVVVEEGRITVARVEKCLTRYSCNWIIPIPPRILSKQATTYDYVSGATESSDAFQDAVNEALAQAK